MAKKKAQTKQEFSYCIGRPWYPAKVDSAICCYSYGSTVFHGNIDQANKMRDFINTQSDEKDYQVYMLVKVPT